MLRNALLTVLCLAPVVAMAGSTAPSAEPNRSRFPRRAETGRDIDFEQAIEFFKLHAPQRYAAFMAMTDEQKERAKPAIIDRFRAFDRLTRENAGLRELKVQQLKLEDEVFTIKQRLDALPETLPLKRKELQDELRRKVTELVEARIKERSDRIENLESLLKQEKARLQADLKQKDKLIETRYQQALTAKDPSQLRQKPTNTERPARPARRER